MDDYFQWANRSKEETGEISSWEEMHLVDNAENFIMPTSEIDELYHDVYRFYLNVEEIQLKFQTPIMNYTHTLQ